MAVETLIRFSRSKYGNFGNRLDPPLPHCLNAAMARGPLHHRQVKVPDLLIAAVAARNALTIVHYDRDYDIIAGVTGQPTRWGAPRGSL